jgi:cold shock CspA family protein
MSQPRLKGTIVSVRYDHNFAFVSPIEDPNRKGEEVFIHATGVEPPLMLSDLRPGDTVTFIEMYTKKGLRAAKVRRVDE